MCAKKTKADAAFRTGRHQTGTGSAITERNDIFEIVQGNTADNGIITANYNIFSVQRQIRVFAGDI